MKTPQKPAPPSPPAAHRAAARLLKEAKRTGVPLPADLSRALSNDVLQSRMRETR